MSPEQLENLKKAPQVQPTPGKRSQTWRKGRRRVLHGAWRAMAGALAAAFAGRTPLGGISQSERANQRRSRRASQRARERDRAAKGRWNFRVVKLSFISQFDFDWRTVPRRSAGRRASRPRECPARASRHEPRAVEEEERRLQTPNQR